MLYLSLPFSVLVCISCLFLYLPFFFFTLYLFTSLSLFFLLLFLNLSCFRSSLPPSSSPSFAHLSKAIIKYRVFMTLTTYKRNMWKDSISLSLIYHKIDLYSVGLHSELKSQEHIISLFTKHSCTPKKKLTICSIWHYVMINVTFYFIKTALLR